MCLFKSHLCRKHLVPSYLLKSAWVSYCYRNIIKGKRKFNLNLLQQLFGNQLPSSGIFPDSLIGENRYALDRYDEDDDLNLGSPLNNTPRDNDFLIQHSKILYNRKSENYCRNKHLHSLKPINITFPLKERRHYAESPPPESQQQAIIRNSLFEETSHLEGCDRQFKRIGSTSIIKPDMGLINISDQQTIGMKLRDASLNSVVKSKELPTFPSFIPTNWKTNKFFHMNNRLLDRGAVNKAGICT